MKSRKSSSRGHMMLEALVGGVVVLTAVGGVGSAFLASSTSISLATRDQQAQQEAMERVEWLRLQPKTAAIWQVASPAANGVVPNHPGWKWTIQIADINDTLVGAPSPGALTYKKATVTINYNQGTNPKVLSVETLKW